MPNVVSQISSRDKFQLSVAPYLLHPVALRGASTRAPRRGALLRITRAKDGLSGFGDLHPWPEFGSAPLDEQLSGAKIGEFSPAMRSTLSCAFVDIAAQEKGHSIFSQFKALPSHHLLAELSNIEALRALPPSSVVKIKVGVNPAQEVALLRECAHQLAGRKVRLDFNGKLSAHEFRVFIESLGPSRGSVELVEDPTSYDPELWAELQRELGVALAVDHVVDPTDVSSDSAKFAIVKPATQPYQLAIELARRFQVIFTTLLDHPIGVAWANWCAERFFESRGQRPVCGLSSQSAYRSDLFTARLDRLIKGDTWNTPPGFGFGDLASELDWQELAVLEIESRSLSGWEALANFGV